MSIYIVIWRDETGAIIEERRIEKDLVDRIQEILQNDLDLVAVIQAAK